LRGPPFFNIKNRVKKFFFYDLSTVPLLNCSNFSRIALPILTTRCIYNPSILTILTDCCVFSSILRFNLNSYNSSIFSL